ncbi:hypothetical protein D1R32_gp414 [Tunisvirus fontaine2]|uniref:Uncharacterized protein n=1 Tax=Tunisvirus fontaine2 TaxID=1421067 RepID=V9SFN2_9VIRU|nr:hypothetical protein D1R32_gp414 [Tunisvirus fontaine2]AHC55131.1 hypothetical protein TNS_ORF413 [Tunisvirus fontaine2]
MDKDKKPKSGAERQRKYRERNKEEVTERNKQWYRANKEDVNKRRSDRRKEKLLEREEALEIKRCVQEFFPDVPLEQLREIFQRLSEK